MTVEQNTQNLKIGALLTLSDVNFINEQIETGKYLNRSHFIREAVRDKIKRIKKGEEA